MCAFCSCVICSCSFFLNVFEPNYKTDFVIRNG